MCTLRNSKCAIRIKIQNTHFAVVWKQSKYDVCTYDSKFFWEKKKKDKFITLGHDGWPVTLNLKVESLGDDSASVIWAIIHG